MAQRKQVKTATKKLAVPKTIKSKAADLVSGVNVLHDEALELAESILFMAEKLKESRILMADEPLVVEYDNGGGQKGIRENPHYVAFEHLMATYTKSLRQLTEIVEKGTQTKTTSSIMAELTTIAGKKVAR
jgi:hypothetical protein